MITEADYFYLQNSLYNRKIKIAGESTKIVGSSLLQLGSSSEELFLVIDTEMGFVSGIDLVLYYNEDIRNDKNLMNLIEKVS